MRNRIISFSFLQYICVAILILVTSAASSQADGEFVHLVHDGCPAHSHSHPSHADGPKHIIRFQRGTDALETSRNATDALRAFNATLNTRERLTDAQVLEAVRTGGFPQSESGSLADGTTYIRFAARAEYIAANADRDACTRVRLRIRDTWMLVANGSDAARDACMALCERCNHWVAATDGFECVLPLWPGISPCDALQLAVEDVVRYAREKQCQCPGDGHVEE